VSIDLVEPDLGAAGLSGFPAAGGDVDGAVACQGVLDPLVHQPSPVEMTTYRAAGSQATWELVYGSVDTLVVELRQGLRSTA
jgi:hypothetical protein